MDVFSFVVTVSATVAAIVVEFARVAGVKWLW